MATDNLKKVKILVLGDTGVGKSSLVHLICHKEVLSHPAWTVGCSVEVKLHDYNAAQLSPNYVSSYFLEFWDVGGAPYHKKGRPVYYHNVNGLILVHDLTNRKSYSHLTKWLSEFHNRSKGEGLTGKGVGSASTPHNESAGNLEYDPEQFVDEEVPLLIVGTKPDQTVNPSSRNPTSMTGAASINLDCTNIRALSLDSPQAVELNKFFDKVIERRNISCGFRSHITIAAGGVGGAGGGGSERLRPSARRILNTNYPET